MSNLERILKRRRDGNEAELDDLRQVVLARLATANGGTADHLPAADPRPVIVRRINGDPADEVFAHPVTKAEAHLPSPWLLVAPLDDPFEAVADPPPNEPAQPDQAEVDLLYEALAAEVAMDEGGDGGQPTAGDAWEMTADPQDQDGGKVDPVIPFESRPARRSGRGAATERRRADARGAGTKPAGGEPTPTCPYCAIILRPPPDGDDWCPHCGQRIVVRRVGARVAFLAESVLPIFEAARLSEERWAQERDRWLELAHEGWPVDGQEPQLAAELISEADVSAARDWYLASGDRAFQVAQTDQRWEEAARIRYEQAMVVFQVAGSPGAPSDDVVRLHRDGLAADLQAIGEAARHAEVRAESCCETCQADDRRVVDIAEELGSPTLPHDGCPDGLCRCRWFLTAHDQEVLAALLRRRGLGVATAEA